MKVRSIQMRTAMMLILVLVLVSPQGAKGAGKNTAIRFAFQDRIGSVIPIVAYKKGFFKKEGLSVKALRFSSGPTCAEALYSGAADFGAMGDTTAVIVTSRSDRFVVIASHATGEHRHRIMVRGDSAMKSLTDLKGRRIGVKMGTSTYGGLLAALGKSGLSPRDVNIIDLTPPNMVDALLSGSIDAFAASEPTPSVAEQKGARQLVTLGGLGNEYPILILANRDKILRKTDMVERFLQALKDAQQYAAQHHRETVAVMAAETGLTPATTRKAMQAHDYRLRLDQGILASLESTARFLKGQGIIARLPDFGVAADSDYLKSLSPSPQ